MVASSKLHHAQVAIENMLPYENMLEHILKTFLASSPDADTQFDKVRPVKRVALIVYSSNSSLCGGFNANVIRMMLQTIEEYERKGLSKDDILIYPIGRKVAEKVNKLGLRCAGDYQALADKPTSGACRQIAIEAAQRWLDGEVDRVEMIYHHFKSAGSQILQRKTFLPIDLSEELGRDNDRELGSTVVTKEAQDYLKRHGDKDEEKQQKAVAPLNDDFIVEPDMATVIGELVPKELHLMVYTALLDSLASEHAARMWPCRLLPTMPTSCFVT